MTDADAIRIRERGVVLGWRAIITLVMVVAGSASGSMLWLDNRFDDLERQIAMRPTVDDLLDVRASLIQLRLDNVRWGERLDAGGPASIPAGGR